ncbi:RNA polymerase sigma factor [Paenibacillus rhizoplanae]
MICRKEIIVDPIEEKIRRIQGGEGGLYSDVIRLYQQRIYLYCYRLLNNKEEAEDAVQDILIKAYQNIGQYKPQADFTSWLYKIAYHHCLNLLRRQKFQQQVRKLLRQEVTEKKRRANGPEPPVQRAGLGCSAEAGCGGPEFIDPADL